MKKNHLILVALAAIGTINSIHAESKAEESAQAVLDNDFHKVKQHARRLSPEEIATLLEVAKQKNAFYQTRLNRWQKAEQYALKGGTSSLLDILTIVGGGVGLATARKATEPGPRRQKSTLGAMTGGAAAGAAVGLISAFTLMSWIRKNLKKWQGELDTSNHIVEFLQEKIESAQQ